MPEKKYKYIIILEEQVTQVTELTRPIDKKEAERWLKELDHLAKKQGRKMKLKRVSATHRQSSTQYIKK